MGIQVEQPGGGIGSDDAERFLVKTTDDLYQAVQDASDGDQLILDLGVHNPSQTVVFAGKRKMTVRGPRGAFVSPPAGQATAFRFEDGTAGKPNEYLDFYGFSLVGNAVAGNLIQCEGTMRGCAFRDLEIDGSHANAVILNAIENMVACQITDCLIVGTYEYGLKLAPAVGAVIEDLLVRGNHFIIDNGTTTYLIQMDSGRITKVIILGNTGKAVDTGVIDGGVEALNNPEQVSIAGNILTVDDEALSLAITDSRIDGNIIESSTTGQAIDLASCLRNGFNHNTIRASAGKSFNEQATCDFNSYQGNHLRGEGVASTFAGTNRTEIGTVS